MPRGHTWLAEIREQCFPRAVGQFGVVTVLLDDNAENHFIDGWPSRRKALVNFSVEVIAEK
jgi:hypothetical protein